MKESRAFLPAFTYTHRMVRRLSDIAAAREVILHALLNHPGIVIQAGSVDLVTRPKNYPLKIHTIHCVF